MIRTVTEDDIPNIQLLMKSVPGFWHESWRDNVLERGIRSAEGLVFVWAHDERIVGFVCAHDVGFRGYLSALVVAEEFRGRGIGKQLVGRVEGVCSSAIDCAFFTAMNCLTTNQYF